MNDLFSKPWPQEKYLYVVFAVLSFITFVYYVYYAASLIYPRSLADILWPLTRPIC